MAMCRNKKSKRGFQNVWEPDLFCHIYKILLITYMVFKNQSMPVSFLDLYSKLAYIDSVLFVFF